MWQCSTGCRWRWPPGRSTAERRQLVGAPLGGLSALDRCGGTPWPQQRNNREQAGCCCTHQQVQLAIAVQVISQHLRIAGLPKVQAVRAACAGGGRMLFISNIDRQTAALGRSWSRQGPGEGCSLVDRAGAARSTSRLGGSRAPPMARGRMPPAPTVQRAAGTTGLPSPAARNPSEQPPLKYPASVPTRGAIDHIEEAVERGHNNLQKHQARWHQARWHPRPVPPLLRSSRAQARHGHKSLRRRAGRVSPQRHSNGERICCAAMPAKDRHHNTTCRTCRPGSLGSSSLVSSGGAMMRPNACT